ncbi:Lipoprotein-anchoring transpeptidase ErfK/SrfK [Amycolatopsis arida]|uniref:Lipoprotein-anchoring transpeptidase ErfK/SrfK n=1 Tax=Amycolatopsis arida TaxID=587909 RepID=A0A1I5NXT7_9PSEU|nr:Ig-like domain-containing protein [Amycolatopsis arida]TDX98280.1 lipoprotein-anchoring transpeptidase ErfK/SrfK [Amycolatopsis arida]SFP26593.1 Lipoprotein-anchoring transpeptidase ErfK/SrfK [Amycolatopsis arida]
MRGRGGLRTRVPVLVLAGGLLLAGCSGTGETPAPPESRTPPPPRPVSLSLSPADGADAFAPGEPVKVAAENGTLAEVALVGADGTEVSGERAADGAKWTTTEKLGYGKTYTLTASAKGADGKLVEAASTFTTATPKRRVSVSVNVQDGETVGVGMPIVFMFSGNVADKDAAERALRVTAEPATEGAFHWFSDKWVTWRPKEYWKPGTKVTVDAGIYGRDLGNGTFGREDRSASFTIGDKLVAVADGSTFQMTVSINDEVVREMPLSMGKRSSTTPTGTYTVMSEHVGYTLDSGTYGVPADSPAGYRTWVKYAVRLSNSGIFYHSAPWSVGDQGRRNVSHGCLNLSVENAGWLMETSKRGDIVVVRNSGGRELEPTDGWSVWQMPWDEWKSGGKKK